MYLTMKLYGLINAGHVEVMHLYMSYDVIEWYEMVPPHTVE